MENFDFPNQEELLDLLVGDVSPQRQREILELARSNEEVMERIVALTSGFTGMSHSILAFLVEAGKIDAATGETQKEPEPRIPSLEASFFEAMGLGEHYRFMLAPPPWFDEWSNKFPGDCANPDVVDGIEITKEEAKALFKAMSADEFEQVRLKGLDWLVRHIKLHRAAERGEKPQGEPRNGT